MNVAWLELMYIPIQKYQVKSHSFPWFSAACATAIGQKSFSFVLTEKIIHVQGQVQTGS